MRNRIAGASVAVMVISQAFAAHAADKVVGWREKKGVHVESGTVTETDNVIQSDNSEFYKTGAGTYVLPGAKLNQRRPPNLIVTDGTLRYQAGEDATVDLATPPAVLQEASFWVDAEKNVVTEESDGATRVTRWCDVRETNTQTPTMGYAVPAWRAADAGFATMLNVKPEYVTKDGAKSVYFGGAKSGQYMNFVDKSAANRTLSRVKHAFVVHGVYECLGAVIGGRDKDHGLWLKWSAGGLPTEQELRSQKTHSINLRSDMAPHMMSARWYLDGRPFDLLTEPPDFGKLQLLAMDSLTTEMPVSCFYNQMGLNYGDGTSTLRGGDYLAEAVFFERKLSESERLSVERYLMKKWNLGADKLAKGQLPNDPSKPDGATAVTNGIWTTRFSGNVAIAKDATFAVETPTGTRTPLVSLTGEGAVVKTGSGSLQIGPRKGEAFTGSIDLQEGAIDVRGGAYPVLKAVAGKTVTGAASGNPDIFRSATNQLESSARYTVQGGKAGEFAKGGAEPLAVSAVDAAVKKLIVRQGQLQLTCARNVPAVDNSKAPAATDLQVQITDPGFEYMKVTNGTYYSHTAVNAGEMNGWTAKGGVHYLLAVSDGEVLPDYDAKKWNFWINRRPVEGNNCIKLNTQYGTATLSQQLSFPTTGRYRLSFYMTGMNNGGWYEAQQPLQIKVDGTTVGYAFTGLYDWLRTYVDLGEITAGLHTLTFSYDPKQCNSLICLDDVRIDYNGVKRRAAADYAIPYGDFEEWIAEKDGCSVTNKPNSGDFCFPKGWVCTSTDQTLTGGMFPVFAATDGSRMATSATGFSATRLLSVRSSDKTGSSYLAFIGNAGRAATTFEAPQGVWYLKAKLAHDCGFFCNGNYMNPFKLQATIKRANGSVVDLGTVTAKGCVFDEVVWPVGLSFDAAEEVTLTLIPVNKSIGVIDDLRLGFAGVNLVQNGSFEESGVWSSCTDKSVYRNSAVVRIDTCSTGAYEGNNRGYCAYDGKVVGMIMTTATYYQDIDFPEPGYYRLSFAARSRVRVSIYGKNLLTFWQGGDDMNAITTNRIVQIQPDTLNFVEHSYLFYVPKKGVRRFGISGEGCPGQEVLSSTENASAVDGVSIVRATDVDADAAPSVPEGMRIVVDEGATLNLDFPGTLSCGPVKLGGQSVHGIVNAKTHPQYVTGVGSLKVNDVGLILIFR